MPAPDYRGWRIIGHNGVATAGCSITEPIMQRDDGTITLLSLGPYGGLSRDTREVVEEYEKQGLLTLFPSGVNVPLPPAAEVAEEDHPMMLSISGDFIQELAQAPGQLPASKDLQINWSSLESLGRRIACLSESKVASLQDNWGETLCQRFDKSFVQTHTWDWDRLERIAKFGLEIARSEGLREHLYRRYCMAMLCRDDGRPPERASRIFEGFVKLEFDHWDWGAFKAMIEGLHQDFLTRRRAYFLSLDNEDTIREHLQCLQAASEPSQTQTQLETRTRQAQRLRTRCGLGGAQIISVI